MFYHQNAPKQLNITITRFRVDVNIFLKIHGLKPSKTEIHNKRKRRISRCEFLDRLLRIGRFPHTTVFDYYYTQNGRKINVFMSRNFEECQVFGLFYTKKSWFSWHCSLYGGYDTSSTEAGDAAAMRLASSSERSVSAKSRGSSLTSYGSSISARAPSIEVSLT